MSMTDSAKISVVYKKLLGTSETSLSKEFFEESFKSSFTILPSQIWREAASIPSTAPTISTTSQLDPETGETYAYGTSGVLRKYSNLTLKAVPGSPKSFYHAVLKNAIPFNFDSNGSYNYSLHTNGNVSIAFGTQDWLVDPSAGTLTFYGSSLSSIGVTPALPPKITFYRYIGLTGLPADLSNVKMQYVGTIATVGDIPSSPTSGGLYLLLAAVTISGNADYSKGDFAFYNGSSWIRIPSGFTDALDIAFNNTGLVRTDTTPVVADDVQEALADLFVKKADLNGSGKVPVSQLPGSIAGGLAYQGSWDPLTDSGDWAGFPADPAVSEYWIVDGLTSEGYAHDLVTYHNGDWIVYNGATWDKIDNSSTLAGIAVGINVLVGTPAFAGADNISATAAGNIVTIAGVNLATTDSALRAVDVPLGTIPRIADTNGTLSSSAVIDNGVVVAVTRDTVLGAAFTGAQLGVYGDITIFATGDKDRVTHSLIFFDANSHSTTVRSVDVAGADFQLTLPTVNGTLLAQSGTATQNALAKFSTNGILVDSLLIDDSGTLYIPKNVDISDVSANRSLSIRGSITISDMASVDVVNIYHPDVEGLLNPETINILLPSESGTLLTTASDIPASQNTFDNTGVIRPNTVPAATTTVQGALEDLYETKADIVAGTVPILQIPAEIRTPLRYVGIWNVDNGSGVFTALPSTPLTGQYWVLSGLTTTIVHLGISYNNGDFIVFNGSTWDRVNNSSLTPVANTTDATCFVGIFESASGYLESKTNTSLLYNATTGALSATSFNGSGAALTNVNAISLSSNSTVRLQMNANGAWGINGAANTGTAGQLLASQGAAAVPIWIDPPISSPLTDSGDIIYGGVAGIETRLAAGSIGQVLTIVNGIPAWVTPSPSSPLTDSGDIIYGGVDGVEARLAIGTAGQVLTVANGIPTWATGASGSLDSAYNSGSQVIVDTTSVEWVLSANMSFGITDSDSNALFNVNTFLGGGSITLSTAGDCLISSTVGGNSIELTSDPGVGAINLTAPGGVFANGYRLVACSSDTTFPGTAGLGDECYRTDLDTWYKYNGSSWTEI